MKLIFIYGLPATGKLTVAQELAALTDYKVFHNHLVVDCLASVFEFGSLPFVRLREDMWLSVFDHACRNRLTGLIFTFSPEQTVRPRFIQEALEVVSRGEGEVEFVQLVCPFDELKVRIESPSRRRYSKLTSPDVFEQLHADGVFDHSYMPSPRLTLDTSAHSPAQAALKIASELQLPQGNHPAELDN